MRTLVVAGNYREYRDWVLDRGIDSRAVKYVAGLRDLFGRRDCDIFFVGTYWTRTDLWQIERHAKCCGLLLRYP